MFKILRRPYAVALAATNLLVRLAGGAVALALVLFAEATRDSFTAAGLLAGSFAVGTAAGAPVTGRLVDRLGATRVLLATAAVHAAALLAIAALPAIPLPAAAILAVLAGAARPPVGAWMRGIWAAILDDDRDRQASYRLESALLELGFIAGPLIAGLVAALGRPALGLVLTAATAAAASTVFALLPPSRAADPRHTTTGSSKTATTTDGRDTSGTSGTTRRAARSEHQPPHTAEPPSTATGPRHDARGRDARKGTDRRIRERTTRRDILGALRSPAIRTLVASRTALGVTLGALQVTAAGYATAHGRPGFAGILLGALAAGSLAGSVALRLRPTVLAAVMCAVLVPLFAPAGLWWLAILFAIAGAPVAPLNAAAYEITERAAPPGTATEARMWTSTATMAGTALGTAVAGATVEQWSPRAALLTALTGALLALAADAPTRTAAQADQAPAAAPPHDAAPPGAAPADAIPPGAAPAGDATAGDRRTSRGQ
ncbi:MFS transporter [Dactylosporangium sp. CA-052675]|uniref:MFS transporter n=1 Tax=Dactylosporangium sp. CA-052675 TaxID=3239927 RepID=UPI003D90E6E5